MMRIFTGFDPREAVGWHTCLQSIRETCSMPFSIEVLERDQRDGSNAFTFDRFSVPGRCSYRGYALYIDCADMLVRSDLAELWAMRDGWSAVSVAKHDYATKRPLKYLGTEMESANEDYPRKNWSSVMLFWNDHAACRRLTPEYVKKASGKALHRFEWCPDDRIGELPLEWNWLDEYGQNDAAKIMHYTTGIPGFNEYRDAPHADEWRAMMNRALRGLQTHKVEEQSRLVLSER